MTRRDQVRSLVLARLVAGEVDVGEAATMLGLSERSVWRLRARFLAEGPAGLVHGNRGRSPAHRLDEAIRARVLELAGTTYAGLNDCHLADLLAEREGIVVGRVTLRRLLRGAGRASPRRRRAPRHRSRRDRMPQAGLLLQTDGSRHDWLGDRGPRLTLVAAIDDATGIVTGATFRDQEDAAGYLIVLRETVRRHGIPVALYRDRHTIFETSDRDLDLEEQLADRRTPTQVGRALAELGIGSIAARSPQAKGRVERLWGTLQDRLVAELRLAGIGDRDAANRFLPPFLRRFDRTFSVPPADPAAAWRPSPGNTALERICSLRYRRVVANDHTVRAGATILQLPPGPGRRGYAGAEVELQLRLDGRIAVWHADRRLLVTPAPADPVQVRALAKARPVPAIRPPSATVRPSFHHPWRAVRSDSRMGQQRPTGSLNS
ncbi:MAG: ISNCY family transposase [Chloroflexi bacterium]|nr:ISNCY family transposase [Chloroflexota bacterium]